MKPGKLQNNLTPWLGKLEISPIAYRNSVVGAIIIMLYIGMSSHSPYAQQAPADPQQTQQPKAVKRPVAISTAEMEKAMQKAGEEIQRQFNKYDSVLNQQEKNVENLETIVKDQAYINKRLKAILSKFPKDSVEKYEMELAEPSKIKEDTSKKKIEINVEVPTKPKRNLFQRIFGRKH